IGIVFIFGDFQCEDVEIARTTWKHADHAPTFVVGSPRDDINRFAQLKNAALLITSTISASLRPTWRSSSMLSWPNAIGVEASATEAPTTAFSARRDRQPPLCRAVAERLRGAWNARQRIVNARTRNRCSRCSVRSRPQRARARRAADRL